MSETKQPTYVYCHKERKLVVATPATHSRVFFRCLKLKMERCVIDDENLNAKKVDAIEECEEIIEEIDNGEEVEVLVIRSTAEGIRKNLWYLNRFGSWKVNRLPIRHSIRLSNKIIEICDEAISENKNEREKRAV